jgi:hypothetical protein
MKINMPTKQQYIDTLKAHRAKQLDQLQRTLKIRHDSMAFGSKGLIKECREIAAVIRALDEALNNMVIEVSQIEILNALQFYADPFTYFAIGFFPDYPAGALMDDFSETEELEEKPGKLARDVLARMHSLTGKPEGSCCGFTQRDNVERDCNRHPWNVCKECSRYKGEKQNV